MPELHISLLGSAHARWGETGSAIRLSRSGQHLLGFLVVHRQRAHTREVLASMLWGDADEARARRRLNTALWRLRRALAPPHSMNERCVVSEPGGGLCFNSRCAHWVDVAAFEETVTRIINLPPGTADAGEAKALATALDLYAGDLLPGCYADWVLPERRRLEALYAGGLDWLVRHYRTVGVLETAIAVGLRLLRFDPLREEVHRELICLYGKTGQRQQAVRQYDYCRQVLAAELGIPPMPETEAVYRQIVAGPEGPASGLFRRNHAHEALALLRAATDGLDQAQRRLNQAMALLRRDPSEAGARLYQPRAGGSVRANVSSSLVRLREPDKA